MVIADEDYDSQHDTQKLFETFDSRFTDFHHECSTKIHTPIFYLYWTTHDFLLSQPTHPYLFRECKGLLSLTILDLDSIFSNFILRLIFFLPLGTACFAIQQTCKQTRKQSHTNTQATLSFFLFKHCFSQSLEYWNTGILNCNLLAHPTGGTLRTK